jgi:CRP-like cAMP-binding protein
MDRLDAQLTLRSRSAARGVSGRSERLLRQGFVPVLELEPGRFDASALTGGHERLLAVLVLEGLVFLELESGRARAGWLIGPDDLIRPWHLAESPLTDRTSWRILKPTRVAVLNDRYRRYAAAYPAVIDELMERAARTSHWLLAKSLVISSPLVEDRLLLWFALAGERWGKMTPEGVLLELPLTHDLLGALVGARRPTITVALQSLEHAGVLVRGTRGWLLRRVNGSERDSSVGRCLRALGLEFDAPTNGAHGGPSLSPPRRVAGR